VRHGPQEIFETFRSVVAWRFDYGTARAKNFTYAPKLSVNAPKPTDSFVRNWFLVPGPRLQGHNLLPVAVDQGTDMISP
jgi:hypothetical protein